MSSSIESSKPTLRLGLDFETYYSPRDGYSLRVMPTLAYVRDARFQCFGAAVSLGRTTPRWVPHKELLHILPKLRSAVPHITGLAYNAMFDATVLWEVYGVRLDWWHDPMAMAQACVVPYTGRASLAAVVQYLGLGEKDARILLKTQGRRWEQLTPEEQRLMGEYACQDLIQAQQIFDKLEPETPATEMEMIDWTVQSFVEQPFSLDEAALTIYLHGVQTRKKALLDSLGLTDRSTLMSTTTFAELLRGLGVEIETKQGKNGSIPAFAKTDAFMASLLEHEDERVQTLAAARIGHKSTMGETRAMVLLEVARTRDRNGERRIGAPTRYHAAHTGRWGGTDKQNYQNLERPGKGGKGELRKALIARDA